MRLSCESSCRFSARRRPTSAPRTRAASASFRPCSRILAAIFRPERLPEVHVMSAWNVSKAVAVVVVASLAAAGCRKDPEFAKQEYLKSGNRYMESGKVAEAIVQYRNAVQQDPRFGEARLKLAKAYVKVGDGRRSYAEYVRAAGLLPNNPELPETA